MKRKKNAHHTLPHKNLKLHNNGQISGTLKLSTPVKVYPYRK